MSAGDFQISAAGGRIDCLFIDPCISNFGIGRHDDLFARHRHQNSMALDRPRYVSDGLKTVQIASDELRQFERIAKRAAAAPLGLSWCKFEDDDRPLSNPAR